MREGKTSRSYASHKNEVTHTSLVSAGFYHKLGVDFNEHFEVDTTGRKFRRHVMLVGVSRPYNYDEVRSQVQTWLDPGTIAMGNDHCEFVKVDRIYRSIIFKSVDKSVDCEFTITPEKTIVNPRLTIEDWNGNALVEVTVNGTKARMKTAKREMIC